MKKTTILFSVFLKINLSFLTQTDNKYHIIPKPKSLKISKGSFTIDLNTTIRISPSNNQHLELAKYISNFLSSNNLYNYSSCY